jgi:SAM-dependent methyltransferase
LRTRSSASRARARSPSWSYLGCGFGTLLAYATVVYGADGLCVDRVNDLFPGILTRYRITHRTGDIERAELPVEGEYEVIVMTEVIEHLNFHPVPTLRAIHAKLARGGSFFLSTPDADAGWGRKYDYYRSLSEIPPVRRDAEWIDDHLWHYDEAEIRAVLEEAGFELKRLERTWHPNGYGHFNVWATR